MQRLPGQSLEGTVPENSALGSKRRAPAPRPVAGRLAEARANRILEHVEAAGLEVLLAVDDVDRVAAPEQVAVAAMPLVEELRVAPVHNLHPAGELRLLGLDDEVVVVSHQAKGVAGPVVFCDD